MNTTNNLKDLNVTLEDLYKGENKQINIHFSDKPFIFNVILKGRPKYNSNTNEFEPTVDCMISSFGANLFARTNKGMKYQKYKSLSTLQNALTKLLNKYIDTDGEINFTISNHVSPI
jgi:hypothetical protein